LPGDAYAKAFLRTYADFLGLDAKLYVDEYTARFGPRAPESALASAPPRRRSRRPLRAFRPWPLVVAAAAVAVLAVLAWQFGGGSSQPISPPAPVRPVTRRAAPKARATPHRKPQPIPVLSLKAARGRCWIDAHLDSPTGKVVYVGTLAQGTTIRFSLRQPDSPAGFGQFLRAASDPAPGAELPPAGRPADPAALAEAAAEYGIEILGPPGMLPEQA